jgi:MoCo/4Fe-4S cofactor protein with predicted Tat translocation signal
MASDGELDWQAIRAEIAATRGPTYWRSLEELADRPEFRQYLQRAAANELPTLNASNRREFLTMLGASLALAGLSGCGSQKAEKIVPYVRQPAEIVPGKPLYFATTMDFDGAATGLLVASQMGRPTKIEGNPKHPSVPPARWKGDESIAPGASDIFAQAAILEMYDPDRSQTVMRGAEISTWDAFVTALEPQLGSQRASRGSGIRLLSETVTSPTLARQIKTFLDDYPEARWHQFEPVNRDNGLAGARLVFGKFVETQYHVDRADVILSLDSDFLVQGPDHLRHARAFAERRSPAADSGSRAEMSRFYAIESTPTLTGSKADHRLPLSAIEIEVFAGALASRLGVDVEKPDEAPLSDEARHWLDVVTADLRDYRRNDDPGGSLIVCGTFLPPRVHALAHAMNQALGNVGQTVSYLDSAAAQPTLEYESLGDLVRDMREGKVQVLVILGANPVYAAPADLQFADALAKVKWRARLGLYQDETSALCDWHIPQAHFLESWGDARAFDGTASIVQPLIAPLYQGKSAHEVMAALSGKPGQTAYDVVKAFWKEQLGEAEFETNWQTALHNGVLPAGASRAASVSPAGDLRNSLKSAETQLPAGQTPGAASTEQVDIVFRPDPTIWDGRFANNGWLQELPKPFSKLTWDNAALVSPRLAERLGLRNGDVVELAHEGRTLRAAAWLLPGQADHSVTLHLGYGRTAAGRVGSGRGVSAYSLQTAASPWLARGATLTRTSTTRALACTQHHHLMDGRDLVRGGTLEQLRQNPERPRFVEREHPEPQTSLFPPHDYNGHKWAMTIDLGRCTGCNACVAACQAENNIPVVGKDQVERGREMHWIRVDSYFEGDPDNPRAVHQPLPCMHCELAPCELVCPVGATVHDAEGINDMVYNRCVGTRYCSNNCPYKVRRFNFLQYSDLETPSLKLMRNPNVTVRNRGVMEKCTYCIQRISAARIEAEEQNHRLGDGEVVTACQAACPSQAITFGDLNIATSEVARNAASPLNYALLGELNTRPRTTYLAAVYNPNPALEPPRPT